jgi:hypothetical protein
VQGGFNICEGLHAPLSFVELLQLFLLMAVPAAAAGWLRGSRMPVLRLAGTLFLGMVLLFSIFSSWLTFRWGIKADPTNCLILVDDRIAAAVLVALNVSLLATARLARSGRKPAAGSPKPG